MSECTWEMVTNYEMGAGLGNYVILIKRLSRNDNLLKHNSILAHREWLRKYMNVACYTAVYTKLARINQPLILK